MPARFENIELSRKCKPGDLRTCASHKHSGDTQGFFEWMPGTGGRLGGGRGGRGVFRMHLFDGNWTTVFVGTRYAAFPEGSTPSEALALSSRHVAGNLRTTNTNNHEVLFPSCARDNNSAATV